MHNYHCLFFDFEIFIGKIQHNVHLNGNTIWSRSQMLFQNDKLRKNIIKIINETWAKILKSLCVQFLFNRVKASVREIKFC